MLKWNEEYSIGNDRIDFEHRTFLGLVNEFQLARQGGAGKSKLARMLREIALYAKFHFCSEENVMDDIGYPDLQAHRLQHYNLIEVLSNKMLGLDMDQYEPEEIERFLVGWFVNHVTHEDSQIGDFIRHGD